MFIGTCCPDFVTALSKTTPRADCALPLECSATCVMWPFRREPFFRTVWPFSFTSCVVFATTGSPGLLCLASRGVTSVAGTVVPLGMFNGFPVALAEPEASPEAEPEAAADFEGAVFGGAVADADADAEEFA